MHWQMLLLNFLRLRKKRQWNLKFITDHSILLDVAYYLNYILRESSMNIIGKLTHLC